MTYFFILTILVMGLSGIAAQVLLLRELLVSFYGNELTLGVILANWVISEASGVFIMGKAIDRIKNKINAFIILQVLFSLMLPLAIYLSRTFKELLGVPFGETIGLSTMFYASFFIILPVSFCHGALFSSGCKIYPLSGVKISPSQDNEAAHAIGRVYAWETFGTILGGIILTYLFIPYLNSFQIVFILSISNLIICLPFLKYIPNKIPKYITLSVLMLALYLSLNGSPDNIHRLSINKQWYAQEVLDYRNSVYGNIVVTKRQEQYTFFYNGTPIITTPYPDITFVEEFGHLPLLFHPAPKDVLIISAGAGGLINEILKHPVAKVDYVELDPLIINMLKKYPSELTQREFSDSRVNIKNLDGRFFVRTTLNKYDLVLIGLSRPSDLSTNRLFTKEFFSLVNKRLNPDGILALWLPGSLTYLSRQVRDLNACILNALKDTYNSVRIIPGDYNIFLASGSKDILDVSPALITQRIGQQNIKTNILVPNYLDYKLHNRWAQWLRQSLEGATRKINQDFMPFAVFQMLTLWNKQFFTGLPRCVEALENLDLKKIAVLILGVTFILFLIFHYQSKLAKLSIAYSIATTGFFGMLINLILLFSFQVFYGYLYDRIGVLISIFMAGIASGCIFITYAMERIKNSLGLFIKLEVLIILFSYTVALTITRFLKGVHYAPLIFSALFFILGLLMGLEFLLASKIYLGKKEQIGQTVGLLYCADLMGGWLAGIFTGVIFLPILGLFNTCLIAVMLKLSSLVLLKKFFLTNRK